MKTFAYLVRRFFAFGADWYISAILINLLANGISKFMVFADGIYIAIILSSLIVAYGYYVLVPDKIWKGQTLMKRAMFLKVINVDGTDIGRNKLLIRYYFGCLIMEGMLFIPSSNIRSSLLLLMPDLKMYLLLLNYAMIAFSCVSLIMLFVDHRHGFRMIHDRIAHTKVIDHAKIS